MKASVATFSVTIGISNGQIHDGSTALYFSDVAIAQNEVGLLAGKCDKAALLTDIQMSPTLTTCLVLHNTSPIVLVDSDGHLFARLA
jgi:hypothetical protein